jgi:hypothetical protein
MKNYFLLLSMVFLLGSCAKDSSNSSKLDAIQSSNLTSMYALMDESGVTDVQNNIGAYDWKAIDILYVNIMEKYKQRRELNNLKFALIIILVNDKAFLQENSKEAIARIDFYAQEYAGLFNCRAEIMYQFLEKLNSSAGEARVSELARLAYPNVLAFSKRANPDSPDYDKLMNSVDKITAFIKN